MRGRESKETLNRREFGGLCLALSSFTSSPASALDTASAVASTGAGRTVKFHDGTVVPVLGQGSGHVGQGRRPAAVEEEALRTGVSLGMALIDTAESYGEGRSEELISHVIAGQRDRVFLVSKVETEHVTGDGIARACEASLARLGTDYLDLYLLPACCGIPRLHVLAKHTVPRQPPLRWPGPSAAVTSLQLPNPVPYRT